METVFDYNISRAECAKLRINSRSKSEYLEKYSGRTVIMDLSDLFKLRGDIQKSYEYLKKYCRLFRIFE